MDCYFDQGLYLTYFTVGVLKLFFYLQKHLETCLFSGFCQQNLVHYDTVSNRQHYGRILDLGWEKAYHNRGYANEYGRENIQGKYVVN